MAKAKLILPKHLTNTEAVELIYGPPDTILTYEDFRVYQRWMADTMAELPGCIMGAEMGLGKTGAVLKATTALIAAGEVKRPLIVAPLYVAENTWPEEIRTWDFSRDLTFRVVTGNEDERMAALKQDAQATIINRENLRWLHEVFAGRGWPFDMLTVDEISRQKRGMLRVHQSREQRKKGIKAGLTELGVMQAHRASHKRIIGLSGTPAPNGLIDLYGPMFAVDGGERLGRSMTAFKQRWFHEDKYDNSITPLPHAEAEIMGRIKDRFFSLREEDYLTLPPMIPVHHTVKLPPKARSIYREMEKELYVELVNRAGDPTFVEAVNRGVLTGKLLQLANGSIYDDVKEGIFVHDEKIDILESIFEEAAGTPVLIAYSFKFDLLAIKKRFPWIRVFGESKDDIRDWNAGRIKGLLTHPASAGHGLNIQKGSNIAVWYGLSWSLELYRQFVKRLHRSGQTRDKVFMHHIIAEDTVDEDVLSVCLGKGETQDRITEAVRVRLSGV
jgi:hypothetical protein